MASKRQRKRQPPVSLSPLEPEDALAGLMQVKPEKENQMPKFKEGDRVRISVDAKVAPAEAKGEEGDVEGNGFFGPLVQLSGQPEQPQQIWYQVRLVEKQREITAEESELTLL